MKIANSLAHSLLKTFTAKDYVNFIKNSNNPLYFQEKYLLSLVKRNSKTLFGQQHRFSQIRCIDDFQKFVPISNYDDYQPFIDEIAKGKPSVLTNSRVTNLVPTSGTSGFNKFIPYTSETTTEFNYALYVWMHSLYKEFPKLSKGKAFWLISPAGKKPHFVSVIPVGFKSDDSYFGKIGRLLISKVMVLPSEIQSISDANSNLYLSCLYLLNCSDLNLISVWNPTYLGGLLKFIVTNKTMLVNSIRTGTVTYPIDDEGNGNHNFSILKDEKRAKQIESLIVVGNIENTSWEKVWPNLQLISCWTDAWTAGAIARLQRLFKNTTIQGKGLLATEGVVSIPVMGYYLPAYFSHFIEFVDTENQQIKLLSELEIGKTYEIIITTGSGLYRYNLNDLVKVTSYYNKLPSLKFLGKSNNVSDLVGEKLSEIVVSTVLNKVKTENNLHCEVIFLSPCTVDNQSFYTLYTDNKSISSKISKEIDKELNQVFYYEQARRFQQLSPVKTYIIDQRGLASYYELFTSKNVEGTSKYLSLNRQLNLFEKLDGEFLN